MEQAGLCGAKGEYFQSARIDDLSMAFAGLEALLATASEDCADTRMLAVFDNEETGSGTKQSGVAGGSQYNGEGVCKSRRHTRRIFPQCGQYIHDIGRRCPCMAS